MRRDDRRLGMDRPITRRDFINGVGVAITGSMLGSAWGCSEEVAESGVGAGAPFQPRMQSTYYPPSLTGMRGSHLGSFEVAHRLRDGERWENLGPEADTDELYDLVVVGGGLSGLSAAYFFRQKASSNARILILDNHDDFGGHAKRNEFYSGDRMLLMNGGTINIEDFRYYGEAAQRLIRELGIEVERYSEFLDENLYASLGLRRGVFFDEETFGADHLAVGEGELPWAEFLAHAPLSKAARRDIIRLYEEPIDYMPDLTLEQKKAALEQMTCLEFLTDVAGVHEEVLLYLQNQVTVYWAIGADVLPAWEARDFGLPGFEGMGFPQPSWDDAQYFRFPDGNASIARLLVRSMIPEVAPAGPTEDIVTALFDYAQLDRERAPVRVRLNSMAVRVRDLRDEEAVEVTYVREGSALRVRGRHCVMACYNAVIPYLCPELPAQQKTALSYALKAPVVYTNVLLRDWKSFERLGIDGVYCPGSYHNLFRLSTPVSMGRYQCARTPSEPMVVQMYRVPLSPGLSAPEQWKAGRRELLTTSFETFEREIRDQLARILSPGGFDPARDIEAITVNRWPHGYAYGYDPATGEVGWNLDWPEERRTWSRARRPFGRITIANSDAAANAMTEAAIGEAYRAVQEILAGPS